MKEEIFRYTAEVSVPLPLPHEEYQFLQRKLNLIHVGTEQPPMSATIPQSAKDAHWYLNAGCNQQVEVVIYSDGSREIVGLVTEEA